MELGGSDSFIVCEDADLESAVHSGVHSRLINSGQTCISAKRFLVHKSLYADYLEMFIREMRSAQVGNPMDEQTAVGPMARSDLRDGLVQQVKRAEEAGARVELNVEPSEERGFFFGPSVLVGVEPDNPVWREELFGPVAIVRPFKDDAEAVTLANDSPYGLAATIWTNSAARAESFPGNLDVGCVFVNEVVKSDPRLPFGGTKESGFGRELSREGLLEFVNAKTVVVR
jgi:succinate-semialdehyde dehydrogenase/glutarate-semialdehyde dehydrogenase